MDTRGRIARKQPPLPNVCKTVFTLLPEDVQMIIWGCLTLRELVRFSATCRAHRQFLQTHQWLFCVLYYKFAYGVDLSSDTDSSRNPLHLDPSNYNHRLHDELARMHIMDDPPSCTSWHQLLMWQMHLDLRWKHLQAQLRVEVDPSIIKRNPLDLFSFQPFDKVWILAERKVCKYTLRDVGPLQVSVYKPKTNETWHWNLPNEVLWIDVKEYYVELLLSDYCHSYWISTNAANRESTMPRSQHGTNSVYPKDYFDFAWSRITDNNNATSSTGDKHNPPLKYHGSFDMTPRPSMSKYGSPFLMAAFHEEGQASVSIWHLPTLALLNQLRLDGEIIAIDISEEFAIVCKATAQGCTAIDIRRTSDYTPFTVPLPPILHNCRWSICEYDPVTNSFIAEDHGYFLCITSFKECVYGKKSPEECIRYVDFYCLANGGYISYMSVKNSKAVISFVGNVQDAFPGAPEMLHTSILMLDLKNPSDLDHFFQEPFSFTTVALAAASGRLFVMDLQNVFVGGNAILVTEEHKKIIRKLKNLICLDFRDNHPRGFRWRDFNGNDIGCAWQPPVPDDNVELERAELEQIIEYANRFLPFRNRAPLNAILAYCIAEPASN